MTQTDADEIDINEMVKAEHHKINQDNMDNAEIEFGYCTEFMVKFEKDKLKEHPFDEDAFRIELSEHGYSLLVISDDEVAKVHVHTEYPGNVLTIGQKYGSLINLDIENMREQHTAIVGEESSQKDEAKEKADYAIITIAMRSEEHTSELQSRGHVVCRLLLQKKKRKHLENGRERAQTLATIT